MRAPLWFRVLVSASVPASAALVLVACHSAEKELSSVAKRWSLTIRASQVLPVYPLTEDMQPGDVYLVTTPLEQEIESWNERGFVPLPLQVTRLSGIDYSRSYGPQYFEGTYSQVPHARPADGLVVAPRASFPSYDFEVERGAGLELALPVSGVPVGLGLMNTDSAQGSLVIRDAYTYGVAADTAYRALVDWTSDPEVQGRLAALAAAHEDVLYLRVLTRVFLTRGVSVSLRNTGATSAGLDAGEAKEIALLNSGDESAARNYADAIRVLSDSISDALPGGSLRIAQASRSSVTLDETFDRPLVVGYLGIDVPVLPNGEPGVPLATLERLDGVEPPVGGRLTRQQREFEFRRLELLEIVSRDPDDGHRPNPAGAEFAVRYTAERLPGEEFEALVDSSRVAEATEAGARAQIQALADAVHVYAGVDSELRYRQVAALLDQGIARRFDATQR